MEKRPRNGGQNISTRNWQEKRAEHVISLNASGLITRKNRLPGAAEMSARAGKARRPTESPHPAQHARTPKLGFHATDTGNRRYFNTAMNTKILLKVWMHFACCDLISRVCKLNKLCPTSKSPACMHIMMVIPTCTSLKSSIPKPHLRALLFQHCNELRTPIFNELEMPST